MVRNSQVLYQDLQWQVKLHPPTTFYDGTTGWVNKGRAGDATSPNCSQFLVLFHTFSFKKLRKYELHRLTVL